MKIITLVSAKGGVGKTTLTANLATALAAAGKRVIALDFDPQNALHLHFGGAPDAIDGVSRATLENRSWLGLVQPATAAFAGVGGQPPTAAPDLAVVPAVIPFGEVNESDRRRFEAYLDAHPDALRAGIASLPLDQDDYVLVDTPPGASVYLRQALASAQFALPVVLADAASYATLPKTEGLIAAYCASRADFAGAAYVVNQVDSSRQLAKDVVKVLRSTLGERMVPTVIHQDQAVADALAYETTVLQYDALCVAAVDFNACARWLIDMLDSPAGRFGRAAEEAIREAGWQGADR